MTGLNDKTVVIFRRWRKKYGGGIIALFPQDKEDSGLIDSFEHVGQHGSASYAMVVNNSYPALPHEYQPLKHELESPPYHYKLIVRKRRPK